MGRIILRLLPEKSSVPKRGKGVVSREYDFRPQRVVHYEFVIVWIYPVTLITFVVQANALTVSGVAFPLMISPGMTNIGHAFTGTVTFNEFVAPEVAAPHSTVKSTLAVCTLLA